MVVEAALNSESCSQGAGFSRPISSPRVTSDLTCLFQSRYRTLIDGDGLRLWITFFAGLEVVLKIRIGMSDGMLRRVLR